MVCFRIDFDLVCLDGFERSYQHTHTHHRQSLALEQRNAMPTTVRLLLDHFRKNLEAGAFYSLPREYIQEMGGNEASQYLQPALPSSQQQMATCS